MTIFGGASDYNDQISLVEDCGLTRVGTLPMKFTGGSCTNYKSNNGEIRTLLCFGLTAKSNCHRYFIFHKNNNFQNLFLVLMDGTLFQPLVQITTTILHHSGGLKTFKS